MSERFTISISESNWKPITKDHYGELLFIRDEQGRVDIGVFDDIEWTTELGIVDKPVLCCKISVATPADKRGYCGRCGRYRGGP